MTRGKSKAECGQGTVTDNAQPRVRTKAFEGLHDQFIADKGINIALGQRVHCIVQIGNDDDLTARVKRLGCMEIDVSGHKADSFAGPAAERLLVTGTADHNQAVGHVLLGQNNAFDTTLKSAGAGQDIDFAGQ